MHRCCVGVRYGKRELVNRGFLIFVNRVEEANSIGLFDCAGVDAVEQALRTMFEG